VPAQFCFTRLRSAGTSGGDADDFDDFVTRDRRLWSENQTLDERSRKHVGPDMLEDVRDVTPRLRSYA